MLSKLSRGFRLLVVPLFKILEIPFWHTYALCGYSILEMIRDPSRAWIVTSLSIRLRDVKIPSKISRLDNVLGEALNNMVNLDNLEVWCQLCGKPGHHRYLSKLGARQLRHLSIECHYNENPMLGFKKEQPFSSFSNVEALKWSSKCLNSPSSPLAGTGDPTCFPKLKALEYSAEVGILLAMRPIRRLQITNIRTDLYPQLLVALKNSPGQLDHLIFENFRGLRTIIEAAPSLFVQLQHVGSLPSLYCGDVATFVDSNLSCLKLLPHLTSLDVNGDLYGEWWSLEVLVYLNRVHQKLRKVLWHTYGPGSFVWERQEENWERREVSQFTPWDIIRGACD